MGGSLRGLGIWGPAGAGVVLALAGQPVLWGNQLNGGPRGGPVTGGLLIAGAALPLGGLRRWPAGALAVSTAGLLSYDALGFPASPADLATLFLLAWLIVVGRPAVALVAPVVVVIASGVTSTLRPGVHSVGYFAGGVLAPVLATLIGVAGRGYKEKSEVASREEATALEAHRLAAEQAATGERLRIAREMHDSVGHGVTIATLGAEAASKLMRRDPERAEDLLGVAVRTGKQTMEELHYLLGVLRSGSDAIAARPPERLEEVVRRFAGPNFETSLKVGDGCPAGLSLPVDDVVAAIVAEGLSNAVRHAAARHAVVEVTFESGSLRVTVTDDGQGPGSTTFGFGLTGAAERARSVGGDLRLVASPAGGSCLEAVLPCSIEVGR